MALSVAGCSKTMKPRLNLLLHLALALSLLVTPAIAQPREPHAQPAGWVHIEPEGKPFSVLIPAHWTRNELNLLKEHQKYELKLWAPERTDLAYVLIGVDYFADPHKTPERYLFEQSNPVFAQRHTIHIEPEQPTTSGSGVISFTVHTDRFPPLGLSTKKQAVLRHVILHPMQKGFAVLYFDAPTTLAEQYRPVFEQVAASFKPLAQQEANTLPDLSADEYAVLTDFFRNNPKKTTEPPPRFFEDVRRVRVVNGQTGNKGKLDEATRQGLAREFGELDPHLVADYRDKNARPAIVRDRILVRNLYIQPDKDQPSPTRTPFQQERLRPLDLPGLNSSIVQVSRIGFDAPRKTALFHVFLFGGGPSTGHFVLMTRDDGPWQVRHAALTDYLIH